MVKYSFTSRLVALLVTTASLLPLERCNKEYAPPINVKYTSNSLESTIQKEIQRQYVHSISSSSNTEQRTADSKQDDTTKNNVGGIFQEGNLINYVPKLKWDTNKLEKVNTLYSNLNDDAKFTLNEIEYISQFFNYIRINGKKLEVQIKTLSNLELKRNSFQNWDKSLGVITIVPSKLLEYLDGRGGDALSLNLDGDTFYDSGRIHLKERAEILKNVGKGEILIIGAGDNPYTILHELRHLFISLEEPTKEEDRELRLLASKIQQQIEKSK